jgi:hypothetical protein
LGLFHLWDNGTVDTLIVSQSHGLKLYLTQNVVQPSVFCYTDNF